MNQEELLIAAIAIITIVLTSLIMWLQNKLDTARDYISPVLERRNQDEALFGTLRRTIATTRKQLADEKMFAVKLISDHTKQLAESYRHAIELQEKNTSLSTETKRANDTIEKAKKLLQKGAKGQDTLAALILIEEYQKNKLTL